MISETSDPSLRALHVVVDGLVDPTPALNVAGGPLAPKRTLNLRWVVDAALGLFDDGGPSSLSVRAVSGRLGVRPNALFAYVRDRRALERAIVQGVLAEADVALLDLLPSPGAPGRRPTPAACAPRCCDTREASRCS